MIRSMASLVGIDFLVEDGNERTALGIVGIVIRIARFRDDFRVN